MQITWFYRALKDFCDESQEARIKIQEKEVFLTLESII
ncbi:MAG: hypothetical protein JWQ54_731 [Mucilaginibacter sp.]|jgi:hypothetical protein|nr:hypothetical protein [Mucilaginibacter sp.]